jgi:hypothetical protein
MVKRLGLALACALGISAGLLAPGAAIAKDGPAAEPSGPASTAEERASKLTNTLVIGVVVGIIAVGAGKLGKDYFTARKPVRRDSWW